jgi:hypothetical protein
MPKVKSSNKAKLIAYVSEFPVLKHDGSILFCTACDCSVTFDIRSQVTQHLSSSKHLRKSTHAKVEKQSFVTDINSDSQTQFYIDMCNAFVGANIPLWKLQNSNLRQFLEKYTKKNIPDESTLRKNYVGHCYDAKLSHLREELKNQRIWISVDETTDCCNRYVVNVIVGALRTDRASEPFLLLTTFVENTNSTTVAQTFAEATQLLWPEGVKYDNVLLFVSDGAAYMKKA